jgi:two-component system chemotaxis response regulator CheB
MPANFTGRFAARLDNALPQHVAEASDGEVLRPGQIRIAPGDRHLAVVNAAGRLTVKLDDSGPISGHRPSVDVLFNAVSTAAGSRALGLILTGMGRDGAAGLRAMRNAGAWCIAQDEASCVVYGMPKAARELQAIDEQLDLALIGPRICEILNPGAARKTA